MDDDQQFCLRWNNHQSTLISVFDTLLENGTLVDCTLAAEGKFLKAHKVVLSACSPYFAALLSQQYDKHPIFILKDVKFQELRAMMDYMYRGEVNISQDQLAALLKAAESLQIKGLSDSRGSSSSQQQKSEATASKTLPPPVPANKASGLTIENKRPLKSVGTTDLLDAELSGSREGSTSPTSRKRKKIRRKSIETNNLIDNHDQHSNSSSHSMHTTTTSLANQSLSATVVTSAAVNTNQLQPNSATSLSAPSNNITNVLSVATIKKTENIHHHQQQNDSLKILLKQQQNDALKLQLKQQQLDDDDDGDENEDDENDDEQDLMDNDNDGNMQQQSSKHINRHHQMETDIKNISQSELLIEPKNEYDDGHDENVEDLTLDDEELLEDMDQAGPSHGGEGSSQGYAQWQMERAQDEAFMVAQDAGGGQHRDAQDGKTTKSTVNTKKTKATNVLNDLNDCILDSKNIVVSKKDNNYILFATTPTAHAGPTNVQVPDTVKIEELLKKEKMVKKTDVQGGTTTTTYIFDECDILPLKSKVKEVVVGNLKVDKVANVSISKLPNLDSINLPSIPSNTGTSASNIVNLSSNQSQISNKKVVKLSHPRIKYSKHKNPSTIHTSIIPSMVAIPSATQSQAIIPPTETISNTSKIELLNFSLSRKYVGQQKNVDANIQQIPITAISRPMPQTRYSTTEYETSASNTSQSNDFPSGIIDDLDYSVIDDIELPDDVQVNFADSFAPKNSSTQNMHPHQQSQHQLIQDHDDDDEDDEDDCDDEDEDQDDDMSDHKHSKSSDSHILSTIEDKYALLANTSIMKNFEYTVNETIVSDNEDNESRQYVCRHCGKRYRWKSTLRRHENVECGGKEASHQCPYCNYKAKQRGNLGVHIRKHHADLPQLESRRRSNKSRDSM